MKVALLTEAFSKNMGYLENALPKYLSRLGVETHVITADLSPYYQIKTFQETYAGFTEQLRAGSIEDLDGYKLHVLAHKRTAGYVRMSGLKDKLDSIRPDVVQTTAAIGWIPLDAACLKLFLGYKLFTGNHFHASVFPLANKDLPWWRRERLRCTLTRTVPGRLVGLVTEKCYAIAPDCADIAVRFFGVPRNKTVVCPLGVDTEIFQPSGGSNGAGRIQLREKLGFSKSDIVCIYTGRFSLDKNPLLLAKAVAELVRRGDAFRGLFVGNGTQAEAIRSQPGCVTHPFVPVQELGNFFRAAELGVWPTQESTSMLDAAACALPIVVNDTMSVPERIQGNGVSYKLNDLDDLVNKLLELRDPQIRARMGSAGTLKMAREYSWEAIARRRLNDYQAALSRASDGDKQQT